MILQTHHLRLIHSTWPEGETIKKVIGMLRPKPCTLDPIPTHLIKDNLSNIVRTSLSKGIFPQSLKISHIEGRSQRGSWGARDPPFCKPFLTKQPTADGKNCMTIS